MATKKTFNTERGSFTSKNEKIINIASENNFIKLVNNLTKNIKKNEKHFQK